MEKYRTPEVSLQNILAALCTTPPTLLLLIQQASSSLTS